MRKPTIMRFIPYVVLVAAALPFLALGLWLGDHPDRQVYFYNRGINYANKKQPDKAAEAFKAAAAVYVEAEQLDWLERFFLPRPDPELASLSFSHLGYLAVMSANQIRAGMLAYQQSLIINSGAEWLPGVSLVPNTGYAARTCASMQDTPMKQSGLPLMEGPDDVCRAARLTEEAMIAVYDYEQLKRRPPPGDESREGAGRKKGKQKLEKPKPIPALAPGGKGNTAVTPDGY